MALPKQAQDQVNAANKILADIQEVRQPATEKAAEIPKEDTDLALVPEPVDATVEADPIAEAKLEPVVEAEPEPEPEPEPVVEKKAPDFEHKYNVLKGKYDNEVPRLYKQVSELAAEIEILKEAQVKPETTTPPVSLVTQEEIDEYGTDLIDLIGRKAQEIAASQNANLQDEISGLKSQLQNVSRDVTETSRDRLLSQLGNKVENWQEMNVDPEFLDWLDEVDPFSGSLRSQMLKTAYDNNDTERVIAFFDGFKKEHAAITPQADPGPAKRTPAVDLNDHVAPGKTARNTAPASAQNAERIWTRKQIAEFYSSVNKGKFKSDPDRKAAIEQEILKAVSTGKIQD